MEKTDMMAALTEMMADQDFRKFIKDLVDDNSTENIFDEELKKNRENKLKRGKPLIVDDKGGITAEEKIAKQIGKASKDTGIHGGSNRPERQMIFKECTMCRRKDYMAKGGITDRDPYRCSKCLAGG